MSDPFDDAFENGARALREGDLPRARAAFFEAHQLRPGDPSTLLNLGEILRLQGDWQQSLVCLNRARELAPHAPEVHYNLGLLFHTAGERGQAVDHYRHAVMLRPGWSAPWNNLGAACKDLGRMDEAQAAYQQALTFDPHNPATLANFGQLLELTGRPEQAEIVHREALTYDPRCTTALDNLGIALVQLGRPLEAIEVWRQCLAIDANMATSHGNLAMAYLLLGRWREGWAEHEWRFHQFPHKRRAFPGQLWDGRLQPGMKLLLYPEQGLGDTFQFLRFIPHLAQHGIQILFECPPELESFLACMRDVCELVPPGAEGAAYDAHCALMSLPFHLGIAEENLPAKVPYLSADPDRIERWKSRLPDRPVRVGLAWQGSKSFAHDFLRSIPFTRFEPLFEVPGITWISLQKGLGSEACRPPVRDFGDDLDRDAPFVDTAAILSQLDLVITSDTSIAHLAGALGVRVWVLLSHVPDWRWMLERDDSPWYPNMRLFRQTTRGDWDEVMRRVRESLEISTADFDNRK